MNINLDFLIPIRDAIFNFLKENKTKIIIGFLILFSFYSIFNQYFTTCHSFHYEEKVKREVIKANYRSDMNFLECIAEQHSCVYKNLKSESNFNEIIEGCGDENYCSNPNTTIK
jgi:hypothetical protein